ncbi:MAG TPA: formyltransferase family protein [bacterium]|jgi:methionyl-tRNA formyltransferase|nr:formyltransferase family protein [bacterium]
MRFAIAAGDKFDGVFTAFLTAGWQPLKLFTYSMDGRFQGRAVSAEAEKLRIPVQSSRLMDADLADLAGRGCEALVVANYRWRIGDWRPHLRYAVNFHPSPLPEGRGPWPLVRAIQEGRRAWGVSCHKLSPGFDEGDLLAQYGFPMDAEESHESLDLRCQLGLRGLAARVAKDLPALWERSVPQDPAKASYWNRASPAERFLDLKGGVEEARRHLRAYGLLECTIQAPGAVLYVRRAVAWRESHAFVPASLVHRNDRTLVFALKDGYVGLLEWSLTPPEARI